MPPPLEKGWAPVAAKQLQREDKNSIFKPDPDSLCYSRAVKKIAGDIYEESMGTCHVRNTGLPFPYAKTFDLCLRSLDLISRCRVNLGKPAFSLDEVYIFDEQLQKLHPDNKHIHPKIRQQLQVLRDKGILEFKGKGQYGVVV